jgi:hypothetical protein
VTPASVTYTLLGAGLGDHWASLNAIAHLAAHTPAETDTRYTLHQTDNREALQWRAEQILSLLDIPRRPLMGTLGAPFLSLDGYDVWAGRYYPTKVRWLTERVTKTACTHFTGWSAAKDKNPPPTEQAQILSWIDGQGLDHVSLDGIPLPDMIQALSRCALFVGCDSGPSHIAHSVGCPTFLLEYKLPVVTCHRHKNYVLCKGASHFQSQADNWLHYLHFIGAVQ